MKSRLICCLLTAALATTASATGQVKLMAYNIRNGVGMDDVRNLDRSASVISRIAPDVVAVEEVDSVTRRSDGVYVLGELAAKTGMHATYAPAINYDGGRYGIGMLSRIAPLAVRRLPLPGREEERTMLICEFPDYVYCATHLSLTEDDRIASLPIILRAIATYDKPVFIAGDFNAEPTEPFMSLMGQHFVTLSAVEPTYPAGEPTDTIDYIVQLKQPGTQPWTIVDAEVVNAPSESDHRPITVTLEPVSSER